MIGRLRRRAYPSTGSAGPGAIGGRAGAIAAALVGVARFRHRLGQYPAAGALAEEALTLAPTETPAQADALLMLAMFAVGTELLTEAKGSYRRAADLVSEGDLDGASDLFAVYLTCHQVLRACGDGRAGEVLATARAALLERAALIGDEEMRRSFLENVPHHRALLHELTICPSCR